MQPAAGSGAGAAPGAAAMPLAPGVERSNSSPAAGAGASVVVADAAVAGAAAVAVPHPDGISLAGLRAFVAEHGGKAALAGKTTSEVKWQIVVPETKAAACSYSNALRARGGASAAHVSRANAFVSHVYTYAFLDVIEAVAAWESCLPSGAQPVFYYFDLLVVNQHGQSAAVAPDILWREFTGGVRAIGRTLLVLTMDASQQGPLTRVWCVAEIAAGLQGDGAGSFEVIMTPRERDRFVKELTNNFSNIVQRTCTVNLERAHAWHGDECLEDGVCRDVAAGRMAACSNDRELVLAHVRREISFDDASLRVIARMREFIVAEARAALAAEPDLNERRSSPLQFHLANFLLNCARPAEAEALLRDSSEALRRTLGVEENRTLATIQMLASALLLQGKHDDAEHLYREVLAARRKKLGDAHPSTLASFDHVGNILRARGDLEGAEQLLREALAAWRHTFGNAHTQTLTAICSLGSLLMARGNLEGAEPLYSEALATFRLTVGNLHPHTLTALNSLGVLQRDCGNLNSAEPLFREAISVSRRTLGDAHASTLTYINNLGRLLVERGGSSLVEAEMLSRESLAGRRHVLGDAHASTLLSLRDTANLLVSLGGAANVAEAALFDAEALAGLRRTLGEAHVDVLVSLRVHGRVLAAQGDLEGAADALRASFVGLRKTNIFAARKSAHELVALLRTRGDNAGAAEAEALVAPVVSSPHPDGISLAGLHAFVAEHGGEAALAGMTTSEVKWKIVVPETKAAACSYANAIRSRVSGTVVGRANAFISHVYTYAFLDVIEAIAAWESRLPAGAPPVFYYFDLLVVNQHGQSAAVAPDILWREFTGGVRAIGRTLLVLTLDAAKQGPLTRAWCVAEIATGLQKSGAGDSAGSFEVIMTPREGINFMKELAGDFDNIVQRTCTVDLERAHAWHGDECLEDGVCRDVKAGRVAACSNDLGFVLDNVRREISFAAVNQRVIALMREFMLDKARAARAAEPDADKRAGSVLQFYLARLLEQCGRLAEAEALLRDHSEILRRTLGAEASNTLASNKALAVLLKYQGKFFEAEPLMRSTLAVERKTLGDAHPSTLVSMSNLGQLLMDRGDFANAELLLNEALFASRRTLGDMHPITLVSISNLGMLLMNRDDLDGAEPLYREAVVLSRRTLGDAHLSTLVYICNLGQLLHVRGDLNGAEPLYREGLAAQRRTIGDAHPDTLTSMDNLGSLLKARGDLDGAELLMREALAGKRRTLGDVNPETLMSASNLGFLLQNRGDLDGAEKLFREVLAGRRGVFGSLHAATRRAANLLAVVLRAKGDEAGAAAAEASVA